MEERRIEGRILGLDFGDKTVGVSVTDPLGYTVQGVETIRRERPTKLRRTLARILELCRQYEIVEIVMGYPLNMDGSRGDRCEKTEAFADMLRKKTSLPVTLWDERLTTEAAYDIMNETGTSKDKQLLQVDTVAAVLILEDYLNAHKS